MTLVQLPSQELQLPLVQLFNLNLFPLFLTDFLFLTINDELLISNDFLTSLNLLPQRLNFHYLFFGYAFMEIDIGAIESHTHFHHARCIHLGPRNCRLVYLSLKLQLLKLFFILSNPSV